jgi:hypothetical protein
VATKTKTTKAKTVKPAAKARAAAPARPGRTRAATTAVPKRTPVRRARGTSASAASAAAPTRNPRRAIFIDVENTSSEESLMEVIESLKIDRGAQPTELTAVGNWRAVGHRMARQLAGLGAQLVHSAPAMGVKDWSDLWIAVAAGCWLGQSTPGDVLEIVSNDRAFDAVGDAAAARGVIYRRLLHRRGAAAPLQLAVEAKAAAPRRSRGGRRRRRSHDEHPHRAPAPPASAAPSPPQERPVEQRPAASAHVEIEPHGATREQMLGVIGRLSGGDASRWVNLDILEKALKAEGFARPPGSPRLVTRLRMLREVEVDSHGRVRLTPGAAPHPPAHASKGGPPPPAVPAAAPPDASAEAASAAAEPATKRRRRRSAKRGPVKQSVAEPPPPQE